MQAGQRSGILRFAANDSNMIVSVVSPVGTFRPRIGQRIMMFGKEITLRFAGRLASPINQELRKVPFYTLAQQPALLLFEPNVKGVGVLAIDLDLGKQRKSYTIRFVTEVSDLGV